MHKKGDIMYLVKWDETIHALPEQMSRQERAKHDGMKVLDVNFSDGTGAIRSADGKATYHVTLEDCSCPDFQKRGLPCKHIYLLDMALTPSKKNKTVALILAIIGGAYGIHRFYCGKVGSGLLYMFTGGLFFVGWISDIIKIAQGKFTDGNGSMIR